MVTWNVQVTESPNNAEELFDPDSRRPDSTDAFLDKPVNASDPKQLKAKALTDKSRELKQENDIREVLSMQAGIRLISRLITSCGWNTPHFSQNNSVMCEIAGRRSIAWQLEQWISDTDLNLWFAVRQELEQARVKPKTSDRTRT